MPKHYFTLYTWAAARGSTHKSLCLNSIEYWCTYSLLIRVLLSNMADTAYRSLDVRATAGTGRDRGREMDISILFYWDYRLLFNCGVVIAVVDFFIIFFVTAEYCFAIITVNIIIITTIIITIIVITTITIIVIIIIISQCCCGWWGWWGWQRTWCCCRDIVHSFSMLTLFSFYRKIFLSTVSNISNHFTGGLLWRPSSLLLR